MATKRHPQKEQEEEALNGILLFLFLPYFSGQIKFVPFFWVPKK